MEVVSGGSPSSAGSRRLATIASAPNTAIRSGASGHHVEAHLTVGRHAEQPGDGKGETADEAAAGVVVSLEVEGQPQQE